jgi:hypothetical protein
MVVTDPSSEQHRFEVGQAGSIPAELLPNAKNSLRTYRLEIIADLEISPLLTLRGVAVPGLTAPAPVTIRAAAHWENLGRDPNTREYYVNE